MIICLINRFISFFKRNFIPIILIFLSIYDLRIDILLLLDYFTFSTLIYTLLDHPLAFAVLITVPNLIKTYRTNE